MIRSKRGDTIIEVTISITIFCLVSVMSITLMNSGVSTSQATLEITMARNEIDAQAEAIRFIQNAFLAERELDGDRQQYRRLWQRMTREPEWNYVNRAGLSIEVGQLNPFNEYNHCRLFYGDIQSTDVDVPPNAGSNLRHMTGTGFVINTRMLKPFDPNTNEYDENYFDPANLPGIRNYNALAREIIVSARDVQNRLVPTTLYPRIIYGNAFSVHGSTENTTESLTLMENSQINYQRVIRAEGIWVVAVASEKLFENVPEFYDFHIRTCWYSPGRRVPTTIGTIIRLYNPEISEVVR
jgi:hypothetical protein